MKTIGLIGGMSWESTAHYYAILNRETAAALGGLHSAPVIVHSVDFAPIAEMQNAGDWDGAGAELARIAASLEAQGAGIIGLATNTMHICAPQIVAALSVPFIHIAAWRSAGSSRVSSSTATLFLLPFSADYCAGTGSWMRCLMCSIISGRTTLSP